MVKSPFLFVSYSSKDAGFIHPEIERVEQLGRNIWFDQKLLPTRLWDDEIRKAIVACSCFIVFITEDAAASENVRDEIRQALAENKPILGVYWDDVALPPELQCQIRRRQTLDRHSMHASTYEERLGRALTELMGAAEPRLADTQEIPRIAPVRASSKVLPRIVSFGLLLLVLVFLILALLAFLTPYIPSVRATDDIFNNPWVGFLVGLFFLSCGLAFGVGAFAVFRTYLRSRT